MSGNPTGVHHPWSLFAPGSEWYRIEVMRWVGQAEGFSQTGSDRCDEVRTQIAQSVRSPPATPPAAVYTNRAPEFIEKQNRRTKNQNQKFIMKFIGMLQSILGTATILKLRLHAGRYCIQ